MATSTRCRRKQHRHTPLETDQAFVEVAWPQPSGIRHRLPVVDISVSGLSFSYDDLEDIEGGTNLPEVVIWLGECEILGELLVMHVTPQPGNRKVCGALFYAASDTDLIKWRAAVAGIEAVR